MVKKLSCVSCGSLKRFPHTFSSVHPELIGEAIWSSGCKKLATLDSRKLLLISLTLAYSNLYHAHFSTCCILSKN